MLILVIVAVVAGSGHFQININTDDVRSILEDIKKFSAVFEWRRMWTANSYS